MIYLISGKDKFRRQNEVNNIKEKILVKEEINGFNYQELENPDLSELCAVIQTPAFGSGKKIILVKEFAPLDSKAEDKDIERLCNSLANKPTENIVVFDSEKINGTLKLIKKIKKDFKDSVKEEKFELFKTWDLKEASDWVYKVYQSLSEGKKINYEIAEFIADQVGVEDSAKLYNEIERLITSGKELTIKNLEKDLDSKHDVFKLIKHITQNQRVKALQEFEKLVKSRELNIGLLAILETTLSSSLKLKLAEKRYPNKNELAEFIGMSPGRLYYQQKDLAQVSISHLNNCLNKVLEIERKVKTGRDQLERAIRRDLLLV
jgi:DNA polymerase-3 subunit delta